MEIITSTPPHSTKSQNKRKRLLIGYLFPLSLGGIIQEQGGDADCTFIQRGQVPTFKGANVHPLI